MLSVIVLNVPMPSVNMLSVVAPFLANLTIKLLKEAPCLFPECPFPESKLEYLVWGGCGSEEECEKIREKNKTILGPVL